jgi:hypothetical protein
MSGNVALRNRRRRDHAAHTGGRSRASSVVTVEVALHLPADAAAERARRAVREVTGVDLGAQGTSGSLVLGTFSELVVDLDVEPRDDESDVRVLLQTNGRNGVFAIFLLALAMLSIVGILGYAVYSRGDRGPRARLKEMANRIQASLAEK